MVREGLTCIQDLYRRNDTGSVFLLAREFCKNRATQSVESSGYCRNAVWSFWLLLLRVFREVLKIWI